MSEQVTFSMPFTHDEAETYFVAQSSAMKLNKSSYYVECTFLTTSTSLVYANFTDAAKALLFPNATAHPVSMGYKFASGRPWVSAGKHTLQLEIDGTVVDTAEGTASDLEYAEESSATPSVLSSTTKGSTIRFGLKTSRSAATATGCSDSGSGYYVSFTYNKYTLAASAGTGIASASVTNATSASSAYNTATAYEGDSARFTATVSSGYTWDGWYSGSTRVSTSQTYTATASSDLSLTAKATATATKTLTVTYNGSAIVSLTGQTASSIYILYGSSIIATVTGGTKTLACAGRLMSADLAIGSKTLACSGKVMATDVVVSYA